MTALLLAGMVMVALAGMLVTRGLPHEPRPQLLGGITAVNGIILLAAITAAGSADGTGSTFVALVAVALSAMNLVGGFAATERLLTHRQSGQLAWGTVAPGTGPAGTGPAGTGPAGTGPAGE